MDLDAILLRAVGLGASDVHLKVGQPPVVRKDGELVHVTEHEALGDADLHGARTGRNHDRDGTCPLVRRCGGKHRCGNQYIGLLAQKFRGQIRKALRPTLVPAN